MTLLITLLLSLSFLLPGLVYAGGKKHLRRRTAVVTEAYRYLGAPYRYGRTPRNYDSSTDCSAFVQAVFAGVGLEIPRTTWSQVRAGREIEFEEIKPGDLLFFGHKKVRHVGIYIGNMKFIHASSAAGGVIISSLYTYFLPIRQARRFIKDENSIAMN